MSDDPAERLLRETFAAREQDVPDTVRFTPVRRRMTPFYAAAAAVVIVVSGVYGGLQLADDSAPVHNLPAAPPATTLVTQGPWTSDAPIPPTATAYAAVIRKLAVLETTPPDVLFVLDAPWSTAADPMGAGRRGTPYSDEERAAVESLLEKLAPVEWIRVPADAKEGGDSCGAVRDNGAIITLGPLVEVDGQVQMGATTWIACDGAHWLTYVLERSGTGWHVTGTTGSQSIS